MEGDVVIEAAAGEIEVVSDGDRSLARVHGSMDIALGGVEDNADVLDGFCGVCGSGDTGGHEEGGGESCGKGEKCLFHWSSIG